MSYKYDLYISCAFIDHSLIIDFIRELEKESWLSGMFPRLESTPSKFEVIEKLNDSRFVLVFFTNTYNRDYSEKTSEWIQKEVKAIKKRHRRNEDEQFLIIISLVDEILSEFSPFLQIKIKNESEIKNSISKIGKYLSENSQGGPVENSYPTTLKKIVKELKIGKKIHEIRYAKGTKIKNRRIKWLEISDKEIKELNSSIFDDLPHLSRLSLCLNELETLPETIFNNLSNLKVLDLSNNKLSSLPENIFKNQAKLKELMLFNNDLHVLREKIFSNVKKLRSLSLNNNSLESLPSSILKLQKLERLEIEGNPLQIKYAPQSIKIKTGYILAADIQRYFNHLRKTKRVVVVIDSSKERKTYGKYNAFRVLIKNADWRWFSILTILMSIFLVFTYFPFNFFLTLVILLIEIPIVLYLIYKTHKLISKKFVWKNLQDSKEN